MEEDRQYYGGEDCHREWHQEQAPEIHSGYRPEGFAHQLWSDDIRDQRTETEDHQVEEALGTGAYVLRKELVDEDIHGREEERVGDAVHDVDENHERLVFGEEGENRETRRV